MHPQLKQKGLMPLSVLAACLMAATVAIAQEKKEEEPFWAKGRPKEGPGAKMAPASTRSCPGP